MAADKALATSGGKALEAKARFAECEERIEQARRAAFTVVGGALEEIRDSRLYMLGYKTFEDYCEKRWDLSRTHAYRYIEAAQLVRQLESVPNGDKHVALPAAESHVRALAEAPEHLRGLVWAKVWTQTGGRPTAKAVAGAAAAAKRDFEASEPVSPEEKAVYNAAYEAARAAGGGGPAYIAAGREAVAAYRREHGGPVPAAAPDTPEAASKPDKPDVSAGSTPNARNGAEDSTSPNLPSSVTLPAPVREPAPRVPATVTADEKTVTEDKPHACRFTCRCGKTDTAFSEQVGQLMDELDQARQHIARLEEKLSAAEKAAEVARLSAPPDSHGPVTLAVVPDLEPEAADSAHGEPDGQPEVDADGNLMPDYTDSQDLSGFYADMGISDPGADYEGSQVPGRRRRG